MLTKKAFAQPRQWALLISRSLLSTVASVVVIYLPVRLAEDQKSYLLMADAQIFNPLGVIMQKGSIVISDVA